MKDELKKYLTTDDLAWVSIKLNSHYVAVKKSDVLTDEEKQVEINILMERAMRFGLREIVERMGFLIYEIPLGDDIKPAILVIPSDYTKQDLRIIDKHLTVHLMTNLEDKTPKP